MYMQVVTLLFFAGFLLRFKDIPNYWKWCESVINHQRDQHFPNSIPNSCTMFVSMLGRLNHHLFCFCKGISARPAGRSPLNQYGLTVLCRYSYLDFIRWSWWVDSLLVIRSQCIL